MNYESFLTSIKLKESCNSFLSISHLGLILVYSYISSSLLTFSSVSSSNQGVTEPDPAEEVSSASS